MKEMEPVNFAWTNVAPTVGRRWTILGGIFKRNYAELSTANKRSVWPLKQFAQSCSLDFLALHGVLRHLPPEKLANISLAELASSLGELLRI
jgi:hypothetical protein